MKLLHRHDPSVPTWRVLWWNLLSYPCMLWFMLAYRFRWFDSHRVPRSGPVLYVMNHQSLYDPVLVGLANMERTISFFARASLFTHWLFGGLIRSLNAVPVERGGRGDLKAIRDCVERLKQDRVLLMFPEGTRGNEGKVLPFQPGTLLMIKRAKPVIVPVAVEGAQHALPRGQGPKPFKQIALRFGEPIQAEDLLAKGDEALPFLQDRVEKMRQELQAFIARS